MILYVVCTALNLLGMAYLFYVNSIQKEVNKEFLSNASLVNVINLIAKSKIDGLEERISKLEEELENNKK